MLVSDPQAYQRRFPISELVTSRAGRLDRYSIRHPRFVVERRSTLKRHCPKLTVFRAAANSSVAFQSASLGSFGVRCRYRAAAAWPGTKVSRLFLLGPLGETKFDPAKAPQYPQTVARKSAIRLRPGSSVRGPRRPAARPTSDRPADGRQSASVVGGWLE